MRRLGVIATVPWRAAALRICAESLARQSLGLDELLLFFDGHAHVDEAVIASLRRLAPFLHVSMADEPSGGAWQRLRRAHEYFGEGRLFVFDDDLIYPPEYTETLDFAAARHPGAAVAFGGARANGTVHSYNSTRRLDDDIEAVELQLGVSCFPVETLQGVAERPEVAELLGPGFGTEAALGWWWWHTGVPLRVVAGAPRIDPVILPEGGATDPRALYIASGRDRRARAWALLRETGWPPAAAGR